MGSDPLYAKYPDLSFAQDIFTLTNHAATQVSRQSALKKLQSAITEHKMAPLYRHLAHPTDGLLNTTGEGTASRAPAPSARQVNGVARITAGSPLTQVPWNEELYERLKKENEEELERFQKEEDEAAEKAGETEIQAARGKRAEFWSRVGDKVNQPVKLGYSTKLTLLIGESFGSARSSTGKD